jgi:hypothetical protein
MKLNYSAVKRRRLNHAEFLDLVQLFEYAHAFPNCNRIDEQMKFVDQSCSNQGRIKRGTAINDDIPAFLAL